MTMITKSMPIVSYLREKKTHTAAMKLPIRRTESPKAEFGRTRA
jgi:hypothetical protein